MSTPAPQPLRPSRLFVFDWLLGSTVGICVYIAVMPLLFRFLNLFPAITTDPARPLYEDAWGTWISLGSSAALGLVIGIGQWWALKRYGHRIGGWVWATAAGYLIFSAWASAFSMPGPAWFGGPVPVVINGAILGLTQWLVLRRHVDQALWWILISIGGWVLTLVFTGMFYLLDWYLPLDLLTPLVMPTGISGVGLQWLLSRSSPADVAESGS
jgi:hypothetical protein